MTDSSAPLTPHRWWVLAVIVAGQLMVILDATIVNIALPSAQADLGFSDHDRQWIITAYALAFGSLLLLGGKVSDAIGRRTAFIIGLSGFAAASALGGLATGFPQLVIARALQGAFGALLAPTALALLSTTFTEPAEKRRAFGVWGAVAGGGGALGLLLGGVLTEELDWRWTLFVNLAFAALAVIGTVVFIRRARGTQSRRNPIDILGATLVSGGLFGLVFGLGNVSRDGWGSWTTVGSIAAGLVLLLLFFVRQARAPWPLLPLSVLRDRNRGAAFLVLLIGGAGILAMSFFLSYYLQQVLRFTPIQAGAGFIPLLLALVVSATLSTTRLVPRLGQKVVTPVAMLVVASGLLYLSTLSTTSSYAAGVLPALLVVGLGMGAIVAPSLQAATTGIAPSEAAVASATVNASQQVGGSIGTAVLNSLAASVATGYLASHAGATAQDASRVAGYDAGFVAIAGLFAAGAIVMALLIRRRPPERITVGREQLSTADAGGAVS